MDLFINGRVLVGDMNGVKRYSENIINRMSLNYEIVKPERGGGPFAGYAWEQINLRSISKDGLLWSPANVGPIGHRNHIVTIHDAAVFDHPKWFKSSFVLAYKYMIPQLVKRSRCIITVSEFSKKRIIHHFQISEKKVFVTPLGYTPPALGGEISKRVSSIVFRKYFLCVGSIEERKNLESLMKAWSRVSKSHKDVTLVIVGAEGRVFKSSGVSRLPPQTVATGRVSDSELDLLYRNALFFAYPSFYEGFGLPALEAMSYGLPLITSNTTSIPEVVGDAGEYFNPHSIDDISKKISLFLSNHDLREEYGAKSMARSMQFSWEKTCESTENILRRFL